MWTSLLRNWCQKEESSRKHEGHINSIGTLISNYILSACQISGTEPEPIITEL